MDEEATAPYAIESDATAGLGVNIGRYVIHGVIGSGGMGVVVSAHDPELGRQVAIKLISSNHEEARTRLVREAQAMARLSHPNVVTVHEVVRLGEQAGIVMELVDGDDLSTWCERQPRGWREVVAAYVQAARGLAAAHRAGLVHRDFKPSNALIDRDGIVRVTDFGLVTASGGEPAAVAATSQPTDKPDRAVDLTLTRTGARIGTPAYMAPEQHRGEPVDARTDQWALGCSLYTALYGQRAFAGDSPGEIAAEVLAGRIRPEPGDSEVPKKIRATVRRALALEPADRFATMDELIAAVSPSRRAWHIAVAGGAVAIAAVLAAAVIARGSDEATCTGLDAPLTVVWNPSRAEALRTRFAAGGGRTGIAGDRVVDGLDGYGARWVTARIAACTEARQGAGSPDRLDSQMKCLHQRLVEMTTIVTALDEGDPATLRGAAQAVDRLRPVADCEDPRDPIPRPADRRKREQISGAEDALARGWAMHGMGRCDRALSLAGQAAEVGERSGWSPLLARALLLRGECQDRNHDYAAALATFDQAAILAARAKDDVTVVDVLAHRFLVLGEHMGQSAAALAGRQFIEIALERAGNPPQLRTTWLHFLAIMLFTQGKLDEALAAEEEALAGRRKLFPGGHTYVVDSLETLGNIHMNRGELDRAGSLHREVLAARTAASGPEHMDVAQSQNNVGLVEWLQGRPLDALSSWERASSTARAVGVDYFLARVNLGMGRLELGRWQAAVDDLVAALAIAERQSPGGSRWVGIAASFLGAAYLAIGEPESAGPLIERAIALHRDAGSPGIGDTLIVAGRLAIARGDWAAARARLAEARQSPWATGPLLALADAELARAAGGCSRARPLYAAMIPTARKETQYSATSEATTSLAECLLEAGRAAEAATALEPHLAWLGQVGADDGAMARTRFALARALVATRGDRARARSLAEAARTGFAALGAVGRRRAAEVTRWLARR